MLLGNSVTSRSSFCILTATIISNGLGIGLMTPDVRLRETHVGEWQGLTHDQIERDWPGYLKEHKRPPDFETDESIVERVTNALVDLATEFPASEVLCIAHAGIIRVMRRAHGVSDPRIANTPVAQVPLELGLRSLAEKPLDQWKKEFALGATKYVEMN
jgi:broad specificity phosphatase PhoE